MEWLTEHHSYDRWICGVLVVSLIAWFIDRQVGRIVSALDNINGKLYDLAQGQSQQYNEWTKDIFSIRDGADASRATAESAERLSEQQARILDTLAEIEKHTKAAALR